MRKFQRRRQGCTARTAREDSLPARELPYASQSLFIFNLIDLIDKRCVHRCRNKIIANPLNFIITMLPAADNGTIWVREYPGNRRILFFQVAHNARKRAAAARPGDEVIHLPVQVGIDFRPGRFVMGTGIGGIFKLLQRDGSGNLLTQFLRLFRRPKHAARSGGMHQFCAQSLHQGLLFHGKFLRHHKDYTIATVQRGIGNAQPRIACRSLDNGSVGL